MMKLRLICLCCMVFTVNQARSEAVTQLKTDKEKLSYSIGVNIARTFKLENDDIDVDLLVKGLKSGLAGKKLLLPDNEVRKIVGTYQVEARKRAIAAMQIKKEENKKKGEDFLAANKTKPDVVVLASGVQYKVLKAGQGKMPTTSDVVQVNLRETLLDGTEFYATEPGQPANLKTSMLFAGWKEAMTMMPTGSKWQIFIPSALAYGERGSGSDIEPNSTIILEVELVGIQ